MKKRFLALLSVLLLLLAFSACAEETAAAPAWQAYNGMRLGVLTGPLMEDIAHECFPDSEYLLFNSYPDCIAALLAGKIDAYLGDEPSMKTVHAEQPKIDYIPERITENNYSFAFRKNDPESAALCGELNAFLAKCWADGTMQELEDIWFGMDEERKIVDMSGLTGENGTIRVVTTSTDMPFSYIKDGKNVGYDIDLVVRFCRYAGYKLELGDVDFSARIPAIQSGKYDFTTDMNVTPEREEQVLFSEPTSKGGVVLAVLKADDEQTANAAGQAETITLNQLNGKRIGVQTGTTLDEIVLETLPDAKISYFNSYPDMAAALEANKIDAFPGDEPVIRLMAAENNKLTVLEERMDSFDFGIALPQTEAGEKLLAEINTWLASMKENGELALLTQKWTDGPESEKTVPDYASFPAPKGVLTLATEASYAPMMYYRGAEVVGLEIDLIARFCKANGYGLHVVPMLFDGILPAIQSGKADFAAAGLTITEERKESVYFSDPYYTGGTVMAILKSKAAAPAQQTANMGVTSIDDLANTRIGVQTGTICGALVESRLPNAKVYYYNTVTDVLAALNAGKLDAGCMDEPMLRFLKIENPQIKILDELLDKSNLAAVFPKTEAGQALCGQYSEFLEKLWADGTMKEIDAVWFGEDDGKRTVIDFANLPATNGTLRMAADLSMAPFTYMKDNKIVGYDVDVAARFCQAYGYGLEIVPMDFGGILPSVQSGKCEFASSCITVTEERAESVLFSSPNYYGGIAVGVRTESALSSEPNFSGDTAPAVLTEKQQTASSAVQQESFWDGIVASFNKTFIRENRWELFWNGVLTTLLITVLSILFGTALGFLVFMLCRNGNIVANGVTRFSMWLVQGMPMVVLLMILYYIIFGTVAISGIFVAVIGFTLTFGASVYGLLKMGVGTIDRGQYEAAYALGYANRRTFFRIILPQAIPHILPAYKGEIVGLIKATAIVGYIAVQDLTKMGDIVRSRTYEAFFPLIAVTVIYFILEGLLGFLVSKIQISMNPKKRNPETILKGVKTHD